MVSKHRYQTCPSQFPKALRGGLKMSCFVSLKTYINAVYDIKHQKAADSNIGDPENDESFCLINDFTKNRKTRKLK